MPPREPRAGFWSLLTSTGFGAGFIRRRNLSISSVAYVLPSPAKSLGLASLLASMILSCKAQVSRYGLDCHIVYRIGSMIGPHGGSFKRAIRTSASWFSISERNNV